MNTTAPEIDGKIHRWSLVDDKTTTEHAEVLAVRVGAVDAAPLFATLSPAEQRRAERFTSPHRRDEYILSRWLIHELNEVGPLSISHCRRWIAVAATSGTGIGLDVESRLPRHLEQVAERLGWQNLGDAQSLQAWTLWEAWRKLEGGSVLDEPDAVYRGALEDRAAILDAGSEVDGVTFRSLALDGGCISIAVRQEAASV